MAGHVVKVLGCVLIALGPTCLGAVGTTTERMVGTLLVMVMMAVGVGLLIGQSASE